MNTKKICVETDQATSVETDGDRKVVINSLDYDSLAKIISLLPIPERIDMEEVCTKWKEACQLAWYDIKKYKCKSSIGRSYDNLLLTQSYLEKILLRCSNYLMELSLSNVCDSSIMPFIGNHCKNLTTLECEFYDNTLINNADHFVQAFTQLDKLKCIKITVTHINWSKTINLSAIIDSLPEDINEIHLFSKPPFWNQKGQNISMCFQTVQRFRNLKKLTSVGFCLDSINLQEIADITTLVYLHIGLYDKHANFPSFNKLVNLEYIDLTMSAKYEAKNLSTIEVNTIICTCKNLKHLDIPSGHYDLDEIPLAKWINFKNLEYLGIYCNIMPDLANTIVKYCKNLKHLKISPNDSTMNETALKKLTELENLESLIFLPCTKLSEGSIIAISNNCKKLKRLEISQCIIVSPIDGEPLSSSSVLDELSKLQYLEHLNLSFAKNLGASTIIAIANNCKNLKSLNIQGKSSHITDTTLVALTNMKNLEKLNVGHDISDSFIIRLRGLKEFDCSYCDELTDVGIIQFIKNNPDLEKIDLFAITDLTSDLVIAADLATKNRTNGIILHMRISDGSIIKASKSIIKSQWLVVEYCFS
ncbi:uncharacterized protein LOC122847747 [Aphidius gifuensis]|uniref:uncharacterized protein LOC122847747 n=1 Tax=Aphidius gifuensis TaxID=684658 RepID=UPI001CDC0AB2|nr:uncharacterized protein LOC122847747 [Aphidius gifuensis]XP_044001533.1 uncharacterized protein LOC122847747 [Aphidius gifuensis]XP_044001534.1 uncharacterized protein LOC122847747 [Aphidius gifuensis]